MGADGLCFWVFYTNPSFLRADCYTYYVSFLFYSSTMNMGRHVSPKYHFIFHRLHGVISQKKELFDLTYKFRFGLFYMLAARNGQHS
jgi:hypothetical protein